MKFKVSLEKNPKHSEIVTCVGWNGTDELFSCAEDHTLLCWSQLRAETAKVVDLANDIYPTDLHWFPKSVNTGNNQKKYSSDLFVLTAVDGRFHFISKTGRIEKTVDAHKGAVLCAKWSHDGHALVTGGEDGQVKIWSRSGMLRSTLASNSNSVYHVVWGPESNSVLYTQGKNLIIKSLQPNSKPLQWVAHDGLILKTDWNKHNGLLVSGAEDCKYKVWDNFGRQLYASPAYDYPITSVAWTPDGQVFAVGSFNTLRLCDKAGWCHSLEKPNTGSIFSISWSSDGTQMAGACGNGHVLFAHIIEKKVEWKNFEATVSGRKTIFIHDVVNGIFEKLEFGDNIIKFDLNFGHLIAVTSSQCYIYNTKNWNTPAIFNLKEGSVNLILLSQKHFLLVESMGLYIYSYEGRMICSPKWQGMRPDSLNSFVVSLSKDTLAVKDANDEKVVLFFDTQSGKPIGDGKSFTHTMEIVELALDQGGSANERKLAIVDRNRDLYLLPVHCYSSRTAKTIKIGVMIHSFCWHDEVNMLAALQDNKITVWYYPSIVYVDHDLLNRATFEKDTSEYGKTPQVASFIGNHISIRRLDGALASLVVPPYPAILHGYVSNSRWEEAIRLCRFVKDDALWSCLAGMATHQRELNAAEVSYAAINAVDKLDYIKYIKEIPVKEIRAAEMMMFSGQPGDAEVLLLQGGYVFRAIMINVQLYRWDRALELAVKHKVHLDTVVTFRNKYLKSYDRKEMNKRFLQYANEVEIDWEKISAQIEKEYSKEQGAKST